jgi:hypothetical protein
MLPIRTTEESPLCAHCSRPLEELLVKRIKHDLGKAYVHFCPHCKKVLGISHRKGFWAG